MQQSISRHAREFLGYFRNHHYEVMDTGLAFPRARVKASGVYRHWVNEGLSPREAVRADPNLLPSQGLAYLLETGLNGGSAHSNWYLGLYSNSSMPDGTWAAANFTSTSAEITSQTEGYSGANRIAWVPDSAVQDTSAISAKMENATTIAEFSIVTASSIVVRGAALLSSNVRGGTTGTLISATTFAEPRTLYNGDTYRLIYTVELSSTDG